MLFYNIRLKTLSGKYELTDINIKIIETDLSGNICLVILELKKSNNRHPQIPYIKEIGKKNNYFYDNNELNLKNSQLELLQLLSSRKNNSEIADNLNISLSTLKKNQNLFHILKVETREECLYKYLKLISLGNTKTALIP
jgi:DNA-binding CsgD family transcriptional regulator